jgi:hypothetical protein
MPTLPSSPAVDKALAFFAFLDEVALESTFCTSGSATMAGPRALSQLKISLARNHETGAMCREFTNQENQRETPVGDLNSNPSVRSRVSLARARRRRNNGGTEEVRAGQSRERERYYETPVTDFTEKDKRKKQEKKFSNQAEGAWSEEKWCGGED